MSSLSSVEAKLPPGFRFHPRDDELISDYLIKWAMGCAAHPLSPLLIQVDLNKCEPWDIPETARVGEKDWYFYSQRDRKYATGLRTNRATISGYWKATGKDRPVIRKGNLIGMRKTLVFYQGRAPKGRKTDWVMHEYRLEGKSFSLVKEDWVLCRVFLKNTSQVTPSSSPSLPPLMEPYNDDNNITFADHTQADLYNEQVPCFSIFSTNQTSPTFTHMGPPEIITMPVDAHLGTCNNSSSLISNDLSSSAGSCDEKVIRDVLSQLTKMESASADESPSSNSYLGLSSIWNQYS